MKARRPTVLFPEALLSGRPTGPLFGYAHPESGHYNVLSCGAPPPRPATFAPCVELGTLADQLPGQPPAPGRLLGVWTADGVSFTLDGKPCRVERYSLTRDVFSRNAGILESDRLLGCRALFSGCGSVGSLVALELARAGVGRFVLADPDVLAYHNLCRHQCGLTDVGRWKVDALRDRILDVNPAAEVVTFVNLLEQAPPDEIQKHCGPNALILCCADNREGDVNANRIGCVTHTPLLSIGLWERAFAGELFWCVPPETPCYYCVFGGQEQALSARVSANRHVYTDQEDVAGVLFEPGISADIGFVTTIGVKLALDLLNRHTPGYVPRLLGHLQQFTLVCNSNDARVGGERAELFDHPLQVTRSIHVQPLAGCPHCKLAGRMSISS
jgi:molybdopterin/thiamine biosynthesis adenylyltransferase